MNIRIKSISTFLIFVFTFFGMTACSHSKLSSTDVADYPSYLAKVHGAEDGMPKLSELSDYESLKLTYRGNAPLLLDNLQSVALFVRYEGEAFEAALESVNTKYRFLESDIFSDEYQGFKFGMDINTLDESYPEHALIVGINEEEETLAYLYYFDPTLDRIESLYVFVRDNFIFE